MNKNLKISKYLIIFVIIISIIHFILAILYTFFGNVQNPLLNFSARYFPYILNLGELALNFSLLFIILYFIKNKDKKNIKDLIISKNLMLFVCVINIIGVLFSIFIGINLSMGIENAELLRAFNYFSYLSYLSSIAFYLSLFFILKHIIKNK
jgi:hypothetical protein